MKACGYPNGSVRVMRDGMTFGVKIIKEREHTQLIARTGCHYRSHRSEYRRHSIPLHSERATEPCRPAAVARKMWADWQLRHQRCRDTLRLWLQRGRQDGLFRPRTTTIRKHQRPDGRYLATRRRPRDAGKDRADALRQRALPGRAYDGDILGELLASRQRVSIRPITKHGLVRSSNRSASASRIQTFLLIWI